MIVQSQISKLSNRLQKEFGGRRIPETILERDYCIAWFLVGVSRAPLRSKLAFKGGTALKRCHFVHYRFSEDLDFTLLEEISFEVLKKELQTVYTEVEKASGIKFHFSREDSQSHQNSYTFYLGYEGPLPATTAGKEIKVDVTLKEHLVSPVQDLSILKSYPEYTDFPEGAKIRVYSLEEIASEKIAALLDRARTEPRDLYDLWQLAVSTKSIELEEIQSLIHQKLHFRKKTLDDVRDEFGKKELRLKKTWESRLSTQMNHLPKFEGVFRAVKRELRKAKITLKD
jgi:predicted nucleotidyltransferase component of viral defense system